MGWLSGTFTRAGAVHTGSSLWASSATDGDAVISSSEHDTHDQDLADGINFCLTKDGSNVWTGDLDADGSFHITNMAAGSATGDSGRWDEDVSGISLDGTTLHIEYNGSKADETVDIASVGSAGEVTLSGAQTISGIKTFSVASVHSFAKFSGACYHAVNELTAGTTVAVDMTSNSRFYLSNDQAMTLNVTVPTAASDSELGADFCTSAAIMMRNVTGNGALTLSVVGGADDTETIGSRPTSVGDVYTLVIEAWILNGTTRYVQFTYVAAA